jgi:hypothetical protein
LGEDTNDIMIRPRDIRFVTDIWADHLSRELDKEDWQLNPRVVATLQPVWGPHTIDRFTSMENAHLPRYNARWPDPKYADIDCLHFFDATSRRENNHANPLACTTRAWGQAAPIRQNN